MSLKTQPVSAGELAIDLGLGIDVVSEYELEGALSAGVPGNRILVNGVGKQSWLPRHRIPNLSVHLDSIAEVRALAAVTKALNWRIGLRCAVPQPTGAGEGHEPIYQDQFGMTRQELQAAVAILADAGVAVSGLHFHLHTNICVSATIAMRWSIWPRLPRSFASSRNTSTSVAVCPSQVRR